MAKFTLMVETEDPAEIAEITVAIRDNIGDGGGGQIGLTGLPTEPVKPKGRKPKETAPVVEPEPTVEEIETVKGITAEDLMGDDDKPITFEEVKAAMLDVVERKDAAVAKAVMVAHGVTGKLGEAPKELYPKLLAAFQAA